MLVLVLITGILFSGQSIQANTAEITDTTSVTELANEEISEISEKRTYCTATLDEDFADDTVLVVLNKEASIGSKTDSLLKSYTRNDFLEVASEKVEELTRLSSEKLSEQIIEKEETQRKLNEKTQFSAKSDIVATDEIIASEKFNAFEEIDSESYRKIISIKLKEKGKENVLKAIKQLEERDDVLSAEPNYFETFFVKTPNEYNNLKTEQKWAIDKIGLPAAWDYSTGSSTINVGVIDSGIDSTHPDLTNRINRDLSRNFTTGGVSLDPNPTDEDRHGTYVAGIIGAQGDNYTSAGKTSVAGVCWDVRLVSLKVRDELITSTNPAVAAKAAVEDVIRAITYATSVGIPILNYSGGGYDSSVNNDNTRKQAIINYPGLFVCAAGNSGTNNDSASTVYPASYRLNNLISVGASTSNDDRWSDSCYGTSTVDIYAPGKDIFTTYSGGGYNTPSGTSVAAPYVAGVAALLLSLNPGLSTRDLRNAIIAGADRININTPEGQQSVLRLRADVALEYETKAPKPVSFSVIGRYGSSPYQWDIEIKNNNADMVTITYNERMCFEFDADNFHHLTNLRSFKLSTYGSRTVRINGFAYATHIVASVSYSLSNGSDIMLVSYADGLSPSGINAPKYSRVVASPAGNADIVPNHLDFQLTARYGVVPYEWDVKLINSNSVTVFVTYNSRMCFDDAARNFMGLRDLADVTVPANGSSTVRIRGNGTAQFITAAINYTVDGTRYRRISSANGLDINPFRTNPLRKTEIIVTCSFPTVTSHPSNLSMTPVARSGFLWYTWDISIKNNSGFTVEVSYNAKLCNEGDAQSFEGLADIVTISISAWGSRTVTINHNGTAGWISACINYSYGGYEYRRVTYADGLAVNPFRTNSPKYNLIRFT